MYDKDAECENMMDNLNDDNSIFDFPIDGNEDGLPKEPINDESLEITDSEKELVYVEPEDENLTLDEEKAEIYSDSENVDVAENIDEISIIDQESFMQGESLDDIANEANYEPPKKKATDGKLLLIFIPILTIFLFVGLLWVYAEEWNVPVLADLKKKNTVTEIKEKDVNNIDVEGLDAQNGQNGQNDELAGLLNQDADDSDVVVRTQSAAEDEIPQLPMPGMANGEGNLPPLPGAENGQKGANAQSQGQRTYYTGHIGRLDPFNPSGGSSQLFDIVAPPTNPTPDTEAQQLLSLRISGIMYTPDSPSAIINIAGQDQLVRRGDKFNGFSVERITQDKVTVRNGSNTYTASVGESFNIKDIAGINAIPNLNKKFAGPYSKGKDRIIEINTLN